MTSTPEVVNCGAAQGRFLTILGDDSRVRLCEVEVYGVEAGSFFFVLIFLAAAQQILAKILIATPVSMFRPQRSPRHAATRKEMAPTLQ